MKELISSQIIRLEALLLESKDEKRKKRLKMEIKRLKSFLK